MTITPDLHLYIACCVVCFCAVAITFYNQSMYNLFKSHLYILQAWKIVEQFLTSGRIPDEQVTCIYSKKMKYYNYPEIQLEPRRVLYLADQFVEFKFGAEYALWKAACAASGVSISNSVHDAQIRNNRILSAVAAWLSEQIANGEVIYWDDLLARYEAATGTTKSLKRTIDYKQVCSMLNLTLRLLVEKYSAEAERWEKKIELIRRSVPLDSKKNIIILKKGARNWATLREAPLKEIFLFMPFAPSPLALWFMKSSKHDPNLADLQWSDRKLLPLLGALGVSIMILLVSTRVSFFSAIQLAGWPQMITIALLLLFTLYAVAVATLSAFSMIDLIRAETSLSEEAIQICQRLLAKMGSYGLFSKNDIIIDSIFPSSIFITMDDVVMLHGDTNHFEIKEYKLICQRMTQRLLYAQRRSSVDKDALTTYLTICKKLADITGNPIYQKLEQKARHDYHFEE